MAGGQAATRSTRRSRRRPFPPESPGCRARCAAGGRHSRVHMPRADVDVDRGGAGAQQRDRERGVGQPAWAGGLADSAVEAAAQRVECAVNGHGDAGCAARWHVEQQNPRQPGDGIPRQLGDGKPPTVGRKRNCGIAVARSPIARRSSHLLPLNMSNSQRDAAARSRPTEENQWSRLCKDVER